MSALSWLYTVVAGFAVTAAVQTFALDTVNGRVDFRFGGDLVVFLIFISVVVRFTHGAMRHFYASYHEKTEGWHWHEPPADFLALFAEAFFFLLMAFSLRDHLSFAVYYLFLLLFDTLWLCAIPQKAEPPYKNWLVANVLFFALTIPTAVWAGDRDVVLLSMLGVATGIHHLLDHFSPGNWGYYFPGVTQPEFKFMDRSAPEPSCPAPWRRFMENRCARLAHHYFQRSPLVDAPRSGGVRRRAIRDSRWFTSLLRCSRRANEGGTHT